MQQAPVFTAECAAELRDELRRLGAALCPFLPACSLTAAVFLLFFPKGPEALLQSPWYFGYALLCALLPMSLCITLYLKLTERRLSARLYRPTVCRRDFFAATGIGLAALPLGAAAATLSDRLFDAAQTVSSTPLPKTIPTLLIFGLTRLLIAPILEELFFRGLILERLRRFGEGFAVFLSALTFALLHASAVHFLQALVMGLCFGIVSVRTGSCLSATVLHLLSNLLSALRLCLPLSSHAGDAVFVAVLVLCAAVSAGIALCRFSLKNTSFLKSGCLSAGKMLLMCLQSIPLMLFFIMSLYYTLWALR